MIKKFEEGKQHVFLNQGKMYAAYLNGQYYLGKDVDKTEDIGESANITESGTYLLTPGRYDFEISGGAGGRGGIELTEPRGEGFLGDNGERIGFDISLSNEELISVFVGKKGNDGPTFTWDRGAGDEYSRVGGLGGTTTVHVVGKTYEAKGGTGGKMKNWRGDTWGEPQLSGAKNKNGSRANGYVKINRIG